LPWFFQRNEIIKIQREQDTMNTIRRETATPFQAAIEAVESLPQADQEAVITLLHHRMLERRRAEIARHAEETLRAVREGQAHYGDFADLRQDLLRDKLSEETSP
jgi:hypothetical protein